MKNIIIDFHLHSFHSNRNGDPIEWVDLYHAINQLRINKVKVASFSDHNLFNVEFYKEAYELAKSADILLLPAVEVNVLGSHSQISNIIYVFEENLSENELKKISKICKKETKKRGIRVEDCDSIFSEFNTISIPHAGKDDFFISEDLKKIKFDAIEISNENHYNYKKIIKNEDIKTSVVAFSDTHQWNNYPQAKRLITIIEDIEEISFQSIKNKLKEGKIFYKSRT